MDLTVSAATRTTAPAMTNKHRIVVSAENNPYMAWQCKLLHFSCVSRLNQPPVIVLHETGEEWHPDFYEILKVGGFVRSAPNFKVTRHGDVYTPRNLAGTLSCAARMGVARDEEFVVICDPDMIFVRPPDFPETLAGDYCSYVNFDQSFTGAAMRAMGISRSAVNSEKERLRCGGPYVIPAADAHGLAEVWLEAVDAFPPRRWEDVMYAFGLAVIKLGLKVTLTHTAQSNYRPRAALNADVIHYCYGGEDWDKRHYFSEDQIRGVWEPSLNPPRGTVVGEIVAQIREARKFYEVLF